HSIRVRIGRARGLVFHPVADRLNIRHIAVVERVEGFSVELDSDAFGDRGSLGGAHVKPHSAGIAEGVASDTCDEVLSTGAVQARPESGSGARAVPNHTAGSGHIFQTVRAAVR